MNKNNKKTILFLSISIVIMTTLFISIAYSYFVAKIKNNESESTISVAGGEMIINYQDNTGTISASKIIPSWTTTKSFTVSGKNDTEINDVTTDNNMYYKIVLVIDNNTFSKGALTYSLEQDASSAMNGQMVENISGTINQGGSQDLGHGYFSPTSSFVDHVYNLTVSFPDTGVDQSIDNAKSFAGHIVISQYREASFEDASWDEIAENVKTGKAEELYQVGDEKEVEIDGTSYTVRLANNSTPDECNGEDFSQTACGFVVEFVDIVELSQTGLTDKDGKSYVESDIRTYLNNKFYKKLPTNLRKNIISTNVKSLIGAINIPQYITYQEASSVDLVYLLSAAELTGKYVYYSTFIVSTRQLDYYSSKQYDSSTNQSIAIKQYDNNATSWLLRDRIIYRNTGYDLSTINNSGSYVYNTTLNNSYGVAPAFRIG